MMTNPRAVDACATCGRTDWTVSVIAGNRRYCGTCETAYLASVAVNEADDAKLAARPKPTTTAPTKRRKAA